MSLPGMGGRERHGDLNKSEWLTSGINKYFEDMGLPRPALGACVAAVRSGLARAQVRLGPAPPQEVAMSSVVVKDILDAAVPLAQRARQGEALTQRETHLLRAYLGVVLLFVSASRLISIVNLGRNDIKWSTSARDSIVVMRKFVKTTQSALDSDASGRQPIEFRAKVAKFHKDLHTVLAGFAIARSTHPPALGGLAYYLAVAGDSYTASAERNAVMATAWLTTALTASSRQPPAGCVWLPKSLRSGAASAMSAINVPRPAIEALGGWAIQSTALQKHYIDASMPPSQAARYFFDYFLADADET